VTVGIAVGGAEAGCVTPVETAFVGPRLATPAESHAPIMNAIAATAEARRMELRRMSASSS